MKARIVRNSIFLQRKREGTIRNVEHGSFLESPLYFPLVSVVHYFALPTDVLGQAWPTTLHSLCAAKFGRGACRRDWTGFVQCAEAVALQNFPASMFEPETLTFDFCGVWRKILLERRIWNSARRQHRSGRAESILCPWNIVAKIDRGSAQRRWISKNLALFRQDAVFKQDEQFSTLPRVESAAVCGFLTQRRVVVCLEFVRRGIFGTDQHFSRVETSVSARREKKVYSHVFSAWTTMSWANSRQGLRLSCNFSLNCQFIAHSSLCPWSLDSWQTHNPLFAVILIS